MGNIVEYDHDGTNARGYLAVPESGTGPGLIVIQEWWGLVPHIEELVDRFAGEGFVAFAPDLYDGATTREPDEAGKLMMALQISSAASAIDGAARYVLSLDATTSSKVGIIGFCMGGGLALVAACRSSDLIGACTPFYGLIPWPDAAPDWTAVTAPVQGHFAELDGFFGPDLAKDLEAALVAAGVDAEIIVHPGVEHAFVNDHRPEVYDADTANAALDQALGFIREKLA